MTADHPSAAASLGTLLATAAARLGVTLPAPALAALQRYAELLLAWNQRINLSGAQDLDTLAREHLADALALVPHLPSSGTCIDVGSGAGLPGIVLSVIRSDLRFVLLEPSLKRRTFLTAVVRELGLTNVTIDAGRLEAHVDGHRGEYDLAVARAVFRLPDWLDRGVELVRPGGLVVGLAGGDATVEPPPGVQRRPYDAGAGPRELILLRR